MAAGAQRTAEGVPYGLWVAAYSSGYVRVRRRAAGREGEGTQDGSYFGVFAQRFGVACTLASATQLCLADRFDVTVRFRRPDGTLAQAQAIPLTGDTGGFWFFDAGNPELLVKFVDGRAVNGHFWLFYGSLTDVEYDLVVRHGSYYAYTRERVYHNPQGTMSSGADVSSFGECENCSRSGPAPAAATTPRVSVVRLPAASVEAPAHPPVACTGTATALCLRGGTLRGERRLEDARRRRRRRPRRPSQRRQRLLLVLRPRQHRAHGQGARRHRGQRPPVGVLRLADRRRVHPGDRRPGGRAPLRASTATRRA